jgi:radical SAM superfamily enzyme YgiQ (UPF0313 family)
MRILLYVPDNQVTRNFIPQLWPFLIQRLTPPEHQVTILDGNAEHHDAEELVNYVVRNQIDLVGMGFMTRMAQRAYQMAAALRQSTKTRIVMGGPHVTAVPDEPLGLTGHPQYADSVVVGEADQIWPQFLADAERGQMQPFYNRGSNGDQASKPPLENYAVVNWEQVDLSRFNLMRFVPDIIKKLLRQLGFTYENVYALPVESGRGCPYGCEFCTVTGFFGTEMRFRPNQNVIDELLHIKATAKKNNGLLMVFFVDDNFAINRARTKSLLRDMIAQDACVPFTAQISINLLRDEELVQLLALAGARWIFMGLESVDRESLKVARKDFNRPADYQGVLDLLAKYNLYGITSFIYGMEADRPGVAEKTVHEIESWPPSLPVFGLLTPYPDTPLYDRLREAGRLTRPEHWLDFQAFKMAFTPRSITAIEAEEEIRLSWDRCYGPEAFRRAQRWLVEHEKSFGYQLMHFISRMLFRGIYFPQMKAGAWVKLLAQNRRTVGSLIHSGIRERWRKRNGRFASPAQAIPNEPSV